MYTFKITYIFIIYNRNNFFPYISISVHSTLFNLCFFFLILVLYCIPTMLFLRVIPMYVCTIMHVFIMSTKSGLIKTQIVHAVFIVS